MIQNYQIWLDKELERITAEGKTPRLLLHACCAPCSSYVLEYLSRYFEITVLFYNPNISPASEFSYRADELARLISEMPLKNPGALCVAHYEPAEFAAIAKGMEHLPEGGERCTACYHLRLEEAARAAKEGAYDYFTTTLSISPLKDARRLNNIGKELAVEQEELKHLLIDSLKLLTEKERRVVELYYYEELTLKEISCVLEVTESRVSQLHTKALQKMKSKLGKYMGFIDQV